MSDLLDFTTTLARTAGQVLRERFLQPREIHAKGWRDFYTDADLAAQTTIVDLIQSHDAHAAILSEEGLEPPPGATSLWVIDPLDGTSNYARHLALFAVSIAYVEQGQPIVGVVYDPIHDHVFAAEHDRGAWLNADRLHAATTTDIAEGIIGLDWGREERPRGFALDWLESHRPGMSHGARTRLGGVGFVLSGGGRARRVFSRRAQTMGWRGRAGHCGRGRRASVQFCGRSLELHRTRLHRLPVGHG